jgi:hypothetical protein
VITEADVFVCVPIEWNKAVRADLLEAGVSMNDIRTEGLSYPGPGVLGPGHRQRAGDEGGAHLVGRSPDNDHEVHRSVTSPTSLVRGCLR